MPPFLYNYFSDFRPRAQDSLITETPVMVSSIERLQSVSVTLTPVTDPNDKRILTLHANKPIIIGRSSRSEPKNLTPGTTNALFENPVVSRKHAQLELNMSAFAANGKQVTITDMRSMHGTCVNGIKLSHGAPFQLQTGDRIKFGDKVVRTVDVHDGLIVSVDIAGTPLSNAASHIKVNTGSYKVPSDSDYDSDDMESDDSHDENPISSPHTTPEHTNVKPGSQQSPIDVEKRSGGAIRDIIELASDDDVLQPCPAPKRRLMPETTIVQDSHENTNLHVADSYLDTRQPIFRSRPSQRDLDEETDGNDAEGMMQHSTGPAGILHADAGDYGDADDNSNHSDEDSLESSIMAEIDDLYNDPSDIEEERCDDDLSASDASDLADAGSVSDDEEPEIYSSKRQISPELGTLGQTDISVTEKNGFSYSIHPNGTAKLHYDPVRGSQPPNLAQAATASNNVGGIPPARSRAYASFQSSIPEPPDAATNYDNSSRWDIGPGGIASQYYSISNPIAYDYNTGFQAAPIAQSILSQTKAPSSLDIGYTQMSIPTTSTMVAPQAIAPAKTASKIDIMNLVEDRAAKIEQRIAPAGSKRKADDISKHQPNVTISPLKETFTEESILPALQTDSEPIQQEAPISTVDKPFEVVAPVPSQEPPNKKIKCTDGTTKSYSATWEMSKAAGFMALGGVATIGFLMSDAAERLFS